MRQLSLFDRATTASMRDRTRSRNYSPERDEFRREHERRRYWGLQRRHAEKLRRLHDGPTPPANDDQPRPTPPPPAAPAPAAVSTPPPASPDRSARTPQPARPRVNARPVAAAPTVPRSVAKKRIQSPRDNRRHSTLPVPRGQQFRGSHETYATPSITRNCAHPQKARAPPGERILSGGRRLGPHATHPKLIMKVAPSWGTPGRQPNLCTPGRPFPSTSENERVTALIKMG